MNIAVKEIAGGGRVPAAGVGQVRISSTTIHLRIAATSISTRTQVRGCIGCTSGPAAPRTRQGCGYALGDELTVVALRFRTERARALGQLLRPRGTARAWWYLAPRKPVRVEAPAFVPPPAPPPCAAAGANVFRFPKSKEQ